MNIRAPVDSILDAVLTVSPNRQYLGILEPTTPPTTGPVWIPMRCCNDSNGLNNNERLLDAKNHSDFKGYVFTTYVEQTLYLWGMANLDDPFRRSNAIIAISTACLSPLRIGNPLATMYESFIVSTFIIPYDCNIESSDN